MDPERQQDSYNDEEPLQKRPRSAQGFVEEEGPPADGMEGLAAMAAAAAGGGEGEGAREAVLTSEHLLNLIFSHLCLEDLCCAAMVRRGWREVTSNPEFWQTINLKGRTVMVAKVRQLLRQHAGVRVLNARGVPFSSADLAHLLPRLTQLESLELDKGGFDRGELEAISANLPRLTRLVLAGGLIAGHLSDWASLTHSRLERLELEAGRAVRLRITAPRLTSLSLRDFSLGAVQLLEASQLSSLAVADCGKLSDGTLRALLCLEGPHAAALPSLTTVSLASVPNASDDTLRLLGQRHPAVASLALASCGGVTGSGLGAHGAFRALRTLSFDFCDSLTGAHLSDSVHELAALEELRLSGCAQVTSLRLHSGRLARLALRGARSLQELDLRCARLADVAITPVNPGLAAAASLKRILLASHAVEQLLWSHFPALEHVRLQCPNLRELDLSECHQLKDTVFESLGSGGGLGAPTGHPGDHLAPGCPQLRALKLGECDGLRAAVLHSQTLESLQMSQCRWLMTVQLDCPMLTQLALEECTHLERASLKSRHMRRMSLGTCPRLAAIAIDCPSMEQLDLRGCNQLEGLSLGCPALRAVDATFCSSLSDGAIASVAQCEGLEELVLAVCNAVTIRGLGVLSRLHRLRRLDLSYTPLEDPTPLYSACARLTSLTLSNNYMLRPEALLPLFPGTEGSASGSASGSEHATAAADAAAASGGAGLPGQPASGWLQAAALLPELRELDISYCSLPSGVLAALLTRASRLRSLSINGCRGGGVTDRLWPLLHRRVGEAGEEAASGGARACTGPAADAGGATSAPGTPVAGQPLAPLTEWQGLVGEPAGPPEQQPHEATGSGSHPGGMTEAAPACASEPPLRRHQLRSLSMVGSKELRCFCLGLVPAAEALEQGLLIGGGTVVVADGQQYVPVGTVLAGLQELRLSLSGRLRSLALGLPELTDLQLNNCVELGRMALHCPRLARLSMQACRGVPESVLVATAARCPELRELDLQYCPQVTAEVVEALRRACPSLQTVLFSPPRATSP